MRREGRERLDRDEYIVDSVVSMFGQRWHFHLRQYIAYTRIPKGCKGSSVYRRDPLAEPR